LLTANFFVMNYTIKVSDTGDYILITVDGNVNPEIAMEYTAKSHKLGNELGIMKFLVDLRNARNVEMLGDNYNFVTQDLADHQRVDRRAKVALLVSKEDHSHDFIETVSRNSGHNVTLFRSLKKALKHLRS